MSQIPQIGLCIFVATLAALNLALALQGSKTRQEKLEQAHLVVGTISLVWLAVSVRGILFGV